MRRQRTPARQEPTIALINIVFLMLVFFLVAGTVSPPLARELTLVKTSDLPPNGPPDALVIHADGHMTWRGAKVESIDAFLEALPRDEARNPRVVPDRAVQAVKLIQLGQEFRAAGAETIVIVTERQLQ